MELSVKDLRVGNYVYYADKKTVLKITGGSICYPTQMYPIPLTEEWLIKFGFHNDFGRRTVNGGLCLTSPCKRFNHYNNKLHIFISLCDEDYTVDGECRYVHQLQNLYFALTNEELTVKI
jgi:hypothetical protein